MSRRDFFIAAGSVALLPSRRAAALEFDPVQAASFAGLNAGGERVVDAVRFCWCPSGRFRMGSPEGEAGRRTDEAQADVQLSRGFWMAKFETTQGEWRRIAGPFPDRPPTPEFGEGDAFPMYWVNHPESERFCAALTTRGREAGALPAGWEVRLPTEAQWEYACRAGTTTATSFGEAMGLDQANFLNEPLNGGRSGVAPRRATPVGSYGANAWGICDMHGNVYEWCRDWYHARLPGGADPDLHDRLGVRNGDGTYSRVRRGGAWNDPGAFCRSALRLRYEPERRSDHIGFRVVIVGT
jgi:formylglycine-generating enzyme required for sulfatase activity